MQLLRENTVTTDNMTTNNLILKFHKAYHLPYNIGIILVFT